MTDWSVIYKYTIALSLNKMDNSEAQPPSLEYILKKISDDKTLTLFNSIAISDENWYIILKEMNLTTKQYYSRIAGLTDAGLVKRHKGKYSLTMLGKVVYQSQMIIGKALTYCWKLRTIESIEMSAGVTFPEGELTQLINALIENHQIKDIIMKSISVCSTKEDPKMPKAAAILEGM
jgi:hypothetical protein